jgi:hypothetical protein
MAIAKVANENFFIHMGWIHCCSILKATSPTILHIIFFPLKVKGESKTKEFKIGKLFNWIKA